MGERDCEREAEASSQVGHSVPGACGSTQTCYQPGLIPALLPTTWHNPDHSQWTLAEGLEQDPGDPAPLPGAALFIAGFEVSPDPREGATVSGQQGRITQGVWTLVTYLLEQKRF